MPVFHREDANRLYLCTQGATAGQEQIYSTSPEVTAAFPDRIVSATVQSGEEDMNFDGKPDMIRFIATAQSAVPVYGVKLLLQFRYQLKVRMHPAAAAACSWASSTHNCGPILVIDAALLPLILQTRMQSFTATKNAGEYR